MNIINNTSSNESELTETPPFIVLPLPLYTCIPNYSKYRCAAEKIIEITDFIILVLLII